MSGEKFARVGRTAADNPGMTAFYKLSGKIAATFSRFSIEGKIGIIGLCLSYAWQYSHR